MILMTMFSFELLIMACLVVSCSNYHHTSKQTNKQKVLVSHTITTSQHFLPIAINKMNQSAPWTVSIQNGMIL